MTEAVRVALLQGCELEPTADGRRVVVRAINYDADPYELEVTRLFAMSAEEFVAEWIPPRFEP